MQVKFRYTVKGVLRKCIGTNFGVEVRLPPNCVLGGRLKSFKCSILSCYTWF